jgi:two-component system cell cycle response regulator PopA
MAPIATEMSSAWRMLYIGEPHSFFLALERTLAACGGRLEAAFSSFMGFDFLHEDRFDAVALNASADAATALALCGALRRNARLHHLPTIMLADDNAQEITASAIERGASMVLGRDADREHALAWIFEKIRRGRREAHVEAGLGAALQESAGPSSLFTPVFFEAHMERLAAQAHASGAALSMAALQVQLAPGARPATASSWRRGLYQVAQIAGRLIRAEDTAALLDGDLIVIALPGAGAGEARATAERVASVTECTAFAAGEADAGPIVLEQMVAELAAGESGAGLLARTRAAFDRSDVRA